MNFTAIGCDGTIVNIEHNTKCVISLIEKEIGRPLLLLNYLSHCNELPLQHLFCQLDNKMKEASKFKGKIGQQLENCTNLPVDTFFPTENNLPLLEDKNDLNTDKKIFVRYMYFYIKWKLLTRVIFKKAWENLLTPGG